MHRRVLCMSALQYCIGRRPVWNKGCLTGGINQASLAWQPRAMLLLLLLVPTNYLFPIPPPHSSHHSIAENSAKQGGASVLVWQRTVMHLPTSSCLLYGQWTPMDGQDTLMGTPTFQQCNEVIASMGFVWMFSMVCIFMIHSPLFKKLPEELRRYAPTKFNPIDFWHLTFN